MHQQHAISDITVKYLLDVALNDYILNLTLQRPGDNTVRIALGNYSPSDAAAHIFYFMLAYALLKRFKWNIPEIISGIA